MAGREYPRPIPWGHFGSGKNLAAFRVSRLCVSHEAGARQTDPGFAPRSTLWGDLPAALHTLAPALLPRAPAISSRAAGRRSFPPSPLCNAWAHKGFADRLVPAGRGGDRRRIDSPFGLAWVAAENSAADCGQEVPPSRYHRLPVRLQGCPVVQNLAGGLVPLGKAKCSCRVLLAVWPP